MKVVNKITCTVDILAIYDRMACTVKEKRELLPFIEELVKYSDTARREGILGLENELDNMQPRMLRKGMHMAVDGFDPDLVQSHLFHYALCGGAKGKELLRNMLITEAVLAIQQGDNPHIVRENLLSLMGEEIIEEAEKNAFYKKK